MDDSRPVSRHAIERCRQRYRLAITPADVAAIEDMIRSGHRAAVPLGAVGTSQLWAVRFPRHAMAPRWLAAVVTDGALVTFYPPSSLKPHRKQLCTRRRKAGTPREARP